MQVFRVDVVCCTFAELCYRGESQKLKSEEIFLFFCCYSVGSTLMGMFCGKLELVVVEADMPYHF